MERTYIESKIETISGAMFDYTKPEVNVVDVAHGLAYICRFGGHVRRFYSVAEHSILVARMVEALNPDLAVAALWHDAHEAYIGDLPSPLKKIVGDEYKIIAARIDEAVSSLAGVTVEELHHPIVKAADNLAVAYEASQLKGGNGPGWDFTTAMRHDQAEAAGLGELGMIPEEGKQKFLKEVERLAK